MSDVHVVILAAGKGTRMKSTHPKVLHRVAGIPMIEYVLGVASRLAPKTMTVVVGYGGEVVKSSLTGLARSGGVGATGDSGLRFVTQEPQLGTAHALLTAEPGLNRARGHVILLSGDVPLLSIDTLTHLVDRHASQQAAATVVTAMVANPHGYGRIVRDADRIARIVEEKDATPGEREIREINSGIYALSLEGLFAAVRAIPAANAQQEHYLPDLVAMYRRQGRTVETVTVSDADEIRGINSRAELAEMSRIVRQKKNAALMAAGVTLEDPSTTYIDQAVEIGADTVIHPGVAIEGQTSIGSGCEIHSGVRIVDSRIGDRVKVYNHCVITEGVIDSDAAIGPFAHLRPDVKVGSGAKIGNFVEMKKSVLGQGSKAMHLAYLGDAVVGAQVNIGAGTITCNYDGTSKHTTTIEDRAFIGSDTQLIAPVTVGQGAYIGTGTTIRENVPAGALAVSAGKQRNIEGWVENKLKSQKLEVKS